MDIIQQFILTILAAGIVFGGLAWLFLKDVKSWAEKFKTDEEYPQHSASYKVSKVLQGMEIETNEFICVGDDLQQSVEGIKVLKKLSEGRKGRGNGK